MEQIANSHHGAGCVSNLVELFERGFTLEEVTAFAREEFDVMRFTGAEIALMIGVASHIYVRHQTRGE